MVNLFIVYERSLWNCGYDDYPTLENCLISAVKLVKNANIDENKHSWYGISFDRTSSFPTHEFYKNAIIFGVDMNSSLHIDNKGKDILILSDDPVQGLDGTTFTTKKEFSINFTESRKKLCWSLEEEIVIHLL